MGSKHLIAAAVMLLAGSAQADPTSITIGIYAPSVEFGTSGARLSYVQGLAKAVESATGIKTTAQSYANIAALKKDNVDFAIVDAPCFVANGGWRLLATANIGGGPTRPWALFSSAGDTMQQLRGKKLAFIATGCNDAGFIDNAMLESEVDPAFFGSRVGKPDLTAAVAEVASYKSAQAVFAPVGTAKGLTKVFDTGNVPNPAFVDASGKLPAAIVDKVSAAVSGYGGGGAIAGWQKPAREVYAQLGARLGKVVKAGVLANPEPVRIDAKDVLLDPPTLKESAVIDVRHHFVRAPGDRLE
ncbi:MAG TPA: hypothetical protein VGM88_24275 [Kofleriaceae bacterium]|jgi:hypothetical protein